jgi:hypothetical protein
MISKIAQQFFTDLGALRGLAPVEGGSGKAEGFVAWGETSPLLCYSAVLGSWVSKPLAT